MEIGLRAAEITPSPPTAQDGAPGGAHQDMCLQGGRRERHRLLGTCHGLGAGCWVLGWVLGAAPPTCFTTSRPTDGDTG